MSLPDAIFWSCFTLSVAWFLTTGIKYGNKDSKEDDE